MLASTQRARPQHRSLRRRARGVAAIELALLLTPLLLLTFGAIELGRAIYTYNTLDKTVRDAARYMSQHGSGDAAIQTDAKCLAVYGNTGCTGSAVAPGLSLTNVTVCDPVLCLDHQGVSTGLGTINLVSVSIGAGPDKYRYNALFSVFFPFLDFNAISVTMRAQL